MPSTKGTRWYDAIYRVAAAAVVVLLALRVIRYLPFSPPELVDALLGEALVGAWLLFVFPLLLLPAHLVALGLLALLGVLRPKLFVERASGRWSLRPWLHALIWLELAVNHYLFDLNPFLALAFVTGFLVVELHFAARPGSRRRLTALAGALAAFVLMKVADTWADALAVAVFAAAAAALLRFAARALGGRERRLALIGLGIACELLAAGAPLALPMHGGSRLGDGMAYSFCESTTNHALYAAVPMAPTMLPWSRGARHGRNGYVAEYRTPELVPVAHHHFFSDEFHGRLEWLLCLEDTVQVGMTNATYGARRDQDHAMEFSMADPTRFVLDLLGGGVGHAVAYDARRGALYYVSENKSTILRVDRATGERSVVSEGLQRKWFVSLVVGPSSIHHGRDSLFLAEWLNGTVAYELDLETRRIVARYPHRDGGALGITVDEELDRLYVVGLWGMEVFDLGTGRVLFRRRLGLLSRSPAIDREHDVVYVASTSEGKIRLFDRRSLELLGVIPVGHGPRIPYYSESQQKLFSTSSLAHFYWSGLNLAAQFRERR